MEGKKGKPTTIDEYIAQFPEDVQRILVKIELLATDPRPTSCKKLRGYSTLWRLQVGEYRIIYSIDDNNHIDVSVIRHRSEAYH